MQHRMRNPVARASAAGLQEIYNPLDKKIDILTAPHLQAAIIARKYNLTPLRSRLVCDLAGIGARVR